MNRKNYSTTFTLKVKASSSMTKVFLSLKWPHQIFLCLKWPYPTYIYPHLTPPGPTWPNLNLINLNSPKQKNNLAANVWVIKPQMSGSRKCLVIMVANVMWPQKSWSQKSWPQLSDHPFNVTRKPGHFFRVTLFSQFFFPSGWWISFLACSHRIKSSPMFVKGKKTI